MSWWGKVLGGTIGFMLGGPLGAMMGASFGHNFDRGAGGSYQNDSTINVEKIQSAFFTATFSMAGYMAKADGKVSRDEIAVIDSVMQQMRLTPQQKTVAISLFEKGKQADFPLMEVLQQFRFECHRRRNLLQMFLEIQIATALADGKLHSAERQVLDTIAQALGFSQIEYQQILQRQQASQHMHGRPQNTVTSLVDAYNLLGLDKNADDDAIKKSYRRLMNQHHPDKLVSKGLPQEMMDMATKKTMEIKSAYDLIKQSREI